MDDVVAVIGLLGGYALLMDEDEGLDEGDEVAVPRQRLEPVIRVNADDFRHLEDRTFREQFRMSRALFEELLLFVGNHLQTVGRLQRVRTPLDLCLMMALWILATQDSFRSVAVTFGVPSRGTVHYHFKTIIRALRELAPNFIRWPDEYERDNIKAALERRYGYNGVVGCIDGTAIYISAPLVQPQRYFNGRLHHHTISLQAVCDHNLLFRDIFVGQPGSVHDSMMFKRSPLSHQLLHNNDMLHPDLLGDGAYTLTDKVITPFRMNGNFNRRRRRHNYFHARARSCVERAFALLKIHNEGILVAQEPQEGAEGDAVVAEVDPALLRAQAAGRIKRDYLAYLIYPDDD